MKGAVAVDSEAFYKFINDRLPIADYSKAPLWRKPIDRASRVSKGGVAIARLQARRNFAWNPGSAKWITEGVFDRFSGGNRSLWFYINRPHLDRRQATACPPEQGN